MRNDECRISTARSRSVRKLVLHHSALILHHFRLLLDPPAPGAWNMAVDEALLEAAAADGQCTLRFYQWAEPTLSLGYFQTYADRDCHAASRQCAGGASGKRRRGHPARFRVTYSLAVPDRHPLAIDRLRTYQVVHNALIEVLSQWGIEASLFVVDAKKLTGGDDVGRRPSRSSSPGHRPGGPDQSYPPIGLTGQEFSEPLARWADNTGSTAPITPGRCPGLGEPSSFGAVRQPFLCFQRRAPGDVLVAGEKVAGSAQRRCRGAVLQHGSVLLARSPAAPELLGLKELAAKTIPVEEFHTGMAGSTCGHTSHPVASGRPLGGASPQGHGAGGRKICLARLDECSIGDLEIFDGKPKTCYDPESMKDSACFLIYTSEGFHPKSESSNDLSVTRGTGPWKSN